MRDVLLVSKAMTPPWNDSSKNLARELALSMRRYQPVAWVAHPGHDGTAGAGGSAMGVSAMRAAQDSMPSQDTALPGVRLEAIYPPSGPGFSLGARAQWTVLRRLLLGSPCSLWHFFFSPSALGARVARSAIVARGVPSVHTLCSAPPRDVDAKKRLFADVTVVLSRHSEIRLLEAGMAAERVRRIAPALCSLRPVTAEQRRAARRQFMLPQDAPVLVFPGDLEFGEGASLCIEALTHMKDDAVLVMACRTKTAAALDAQVRLARRARQLRVFSRVRWVGETRSIHALLGAADVVLFPGNDLYAKMDHPLVLLEAMSLERAVVVAPGGPAAELVESGALLSPDASSAGLAQTASALLADDDMRTTAGQRARRAVLSQNDPGLVGRTYEQLYDELLA